VAPEVASVGSIDAVDSVDPNAPRWKLEPGERWIEREVERTFLLEHPVEEARSDRPAWTSSRDEQIEVLSLEAGMAKVRVRPLRSTVEVREDGRSQRFDSDELPQTGLDARAAERFAQVGVSATYIVDASGGIDDVLDEKSLETQIRARFSELIRAVPPDRQEVARDGLESSLEDLEARRRAWGFRPHWPARSLRRAIGGRRP
jgi:hypothetical protein